MYNYVLWYFIGVIMGMILCSMLRKIFGRKTKSIGIIEVDDEQGLARVKMTDGNLFDTRLATVNLEVIHGAHIQTREEQTL